MNNETLITELCIANERIANLENGLEQLKSQLIDGGMLEDSILIITINNLIKC